MLRAEVYALYPVEMHLPVTISGDLATHFGCKPDMRWVCRNNRFIDVLGSMTKTLLPPPKRRHKQYPARESASAHQASSAVLSKPDPAFSRSRAAEADGSYPSSRRESVQPDKPIIHTEFQVASFNSGQTKIRYRFVRNLSIPVLLRAKFS
jgi:hypothetical protein